jgi:hypothetical protein
MYDNSTALVVWAVDNASGTWVGFRGILDDPHDARKPGEQI